MKYNTVDAAEMFTQSIIEAEHKKNEEAIYKIFIRMTILYMTITLEKD